MATSKFGAVTDALVTVVGTAGTTTYDGPPLTGDTPSDYVIVGGTDNPDDDAGEFTQDWNGLGARAKVETGQVICALLVGTGDDTVKTARDRALVILGLIENAVRSDPSLGGVLASGWCQLLSGKPSQRRNQAGLYARIEFVIAYQTHI
jgi:hypothetical protein